MATRILSARIRLNDSDAIPSDGLQQLRLRVMLSSDHRLRSAWRGEITIRGESPCHRGEERVVDLAIDARPFEDYVANWRPTLYVSRDDQLIGKLHIGAGSAREASRPALEVQREP